MSKHILKFGVKLSSTRTKILDYLQLQQFKTQIQCDNTGQQISRLKYIFFKSEHALL